MIYEKIYLKDHYSVLQNSDAYIEIIAYDKSPEYPEGYKRYPMLVVPGGGYDFVSDREKLPSAFAFLAHGFNCVTLNYSCKTAYPIPYIEVACTLDFIHKNAEKYGFDRLYPIQIILGLTEIIEIFVESFIFMI